MEGCVVGEVCQYVLEISCPFMSSAAAQAWTISNGLGNPASLYPNELRVLFDTAFRGDYGVRKSILGFDHNFLRVRS